MLKALSFRQAFSVIASGSLVLTLAGCGAVAVKGPVASDAALVKAWHVPSNRVWLHPTVLTAATRPTVSALPNQASSDAYMWKRADGAVTLWGGVPGTRTGELRDLKPGQTLTIGGNWLNAQMPSGAEKSPLNLVVNAPQADWMAQMIPWQDGAKGNLVVSKYTGFSPNEVQFVAKKPGIYTLQGLWDGHWTLPLVVAVGISDLKAPKWPIHGTQWAVTRVVSTAKLARDPRSMTWVQHQRTVTALKKASLHVGRPVDGWLPVWGKVPPSAVHAGFAKSLTLKQTWSGAWDGVHSWTATLPIAANGSFHGVVRLLVHGRTHIALDLNQLTGRASAEQAHPQPTTWIRSVVVNAGPTVNSAVGSLASAADMNTASPAIAVMEKHARALLANSPSWISGLVAVAEYSSEPVNYNTAYEQVPDGPHDESVSQVVQTGQAICAGYASLASAVLRRAGVPVTIVIGAYSFQHQSPTWTLASLRSADATGFHVWIKVGTVAIDPTGISGNYGGSWSQIDGGTVSLATAFSWTYHALFVVPDNDAISNQKLLKYIPQ